MSDMAKQARAAMKAKANRLTEDRPLEKVDSSSWTPPELLRADVKTGMRPISRRAYKSGGKVEGSKAAANMGKSVRTGNKPITADSLVNKDMKEANEEREGYKHIGGLKSGGRAKKMVGGPMAGANAMMQRAQAVGDVPGATMSFTPVKKGSMSPLRAAGMKKGGSAEKHEDVAEDKALIKKMVKPTARTGKDEGGLTLGSPKAESRYSEATRNARAQRQAQDLSDKASNANYATAGLRGAEWANKQSLADTANKEAGAARSQADTISEQTGYPNTQYKKGGRTKRATGGQVFSGPGYPGKVPGVVPGGRDAHARGGKAGKGKTNINIIIGAGKPGAMPIDPMGGPTLPPGIGAGPPGGIPIQVPPNAPPPGAGAMPMPMPIPMPGPAGPAGPPGMPMPRKSGGRTYRSYKDMDAGAGSGKGRLEKTEIAERSARKVGGRTYSSYKDMDASAANGKGRLEKAEIASKTARIESGNY
jgi:hypothetical protein